MSQLTHGVSMQPEKMSSSQTISDYGTWRWYLLPLVFAIVVDLLTPQLVDWHLLPRGVRWLSDFAIMAMVFLSVLRMFLLDRIPKGFLLVFAATILGFTVAFFEGQNLGTMVYGWWNLFAYPIVAIYVYLMPKWPPWSATWLERLSLFALVFNAVVQVGQYATGTDPGDYLAGMFGIHGVSSLLVYTMITISFGLGKWLSNGDWRYLTVAIIAGVVCNVLAQNKVFPLLVLGFAVLAVIVHLMRRGRVRRLATILLLLAIGAAVFLPAYNRFVATEGRYQLQYYLNLNVINRYLGRVDTQASSVSFALNRNTEPVYVWNNNLNSPASFLFGNGIGSRARSRTFGFSGSYYSESLYTAGVGRSLSVLLHETGVIGLLIFAVFCTTVIIALYKKAVKNGEADMAAVQYGLILFTASWPFWLWYMPIWLSAVPMLLYWASLGFALNHENNEAVHDFHEADVLQGASIYTV